jgi:hypothetical protein
MQRKETEQTHIKYSNKTEAKLCLSPSHVRLATYIDRLCLWKALHTAPRLAPQPLLRQTVDRHDGLGIVRQILIQVGQTVRVTTQLIVDLSQRVTGSHHPEYVEVHHVQCGDVVGFAPEMVEPIATLPEPESFGLGIGVTEGRVRVGGTLEIHLPKLLDITPNYLVRINIDHPIQCQGEQHVEEKNLVAPNDALFLFLTTKPGGPWRKKNSAFKGTI